MTQEILKVEEKAIIAGNSFSKKLVADWLDFNADKSPLTVKAYSRAVTTFLGYLADNGIKEPSRRDVINYREKLCSSKKLSTARLYVTAVKTFSKWLAQNKLYPDFAAGVETPKLDEEAEEHSREPLTLDEAKKVLRSFEGIDEKTLRDKCILRIMLNCGLRSVEVVRLDSTDFERRHGKIFIRVWGKARKGKTAKVQVSKVVYDMIQNYLDARGAKREKGEPLFVSTANRNRGQRLQTQTISRMAKEVFKSVGIDSPYVTCHSCRHFAITQMLLAGVDLEAVRQIARHKSSNTTQIYRHDVTAVNNIGVSILSDLLDQTA